MTRAVPRLAHLFWTVALALLSGCPAPPPVVHLGPTRATFGPKEYERTWTRWTRKGHIIKQLDTTLRVHATCFAPEFVAAYVARRAQLFELPPADRTRLQRRLLEEWDKDYVFFVAAATVDFSWNDFHHAHSVWRVALVADNEREVTARSIERDSVTAITRELFPPVGRFHQVYTFRFPRTLADGRPLVDGGTHKLVLRFAGPLGQTELEWRLR